MPFGTNPICIFDHDIPPHSVIKCYFQIPPFDAGDVSMWIVHDHLSTNMCCFSFILKSFFVEEHKDKIRELWDDIQILAFMEEGDSKESARDAVECLKPQLGDQKYVTLIKIINKIAKGELQPQPKTVKMPPSWIQAKKDREFNGCIITPPDY